MKKKLVLMTMLSLAWIGIISAGTATAQIYNSRVSNRQVDTLLRRIETRTDTFKRNMNASLDRSTINNTNREDRISDFIANFETATDALRQQFNARQNVNAEVTEVLNRAIFIDRFMNRNRLSSAAESDWVSLRTDLNTLARYYEITPDWTRQPNGQAGDTGVYTPAYTVTDTQLGSLLTRIENRTDTFKNQMNRSLDRSVLNNTRTEDSITTYVADFESATDRLKQRFDSRQSTDTDVSDVLTRALYIDRFVTRNRLNYSAQSQWRALRTDLDTLASYYRVSWNWSQQLPPYTAGNYPSNNYPTNNYPGGRLDSRLTGTYRLNTTQSDNVGQAIDRTLGRAANTTQEDRMRTNLERRLTSPEMLAIEKNNRTVTVGSSLAPQVTFEADGVARSETNARGRTIRTTATAAGDSLNVSYEGDRTNDFYLTFMPVGNDQLRVTRRLYLENRGEQITVTSVYDKINSVAQWSTVNNGSTWSGNTSGTTYTDFYIPNGTRLTATLRNNVDSKISQVGDRFTMEVSSPNQYRGAVIEGRVSQVGNSGRISGRANVSLDFDTIRMPNGQTYRFAGIIDSVRAANGDNVSVNNEGTVRDNNQTTKTVTRAGIGAALGALIGAIAGGGQGAAIGAAVGAGAGAGTVLVQGRDNVVLEQGSEFNITATGPNSVGYNR